MVLPGSVICILVTKKERKGEIISLLPRPSANFQPNFNSHIGKPTLPISVGVSSANPLVKKVNKSIGVLLNNFNVPVIVELTPPNGIVNSKSENKTSMPRADKIIPPGSAPALSCFKALVAFSLDISIVGIAFAPFNHIST